MTEIRADNRLDKYGAKAMFETKEAKDWVRWATVYALIAFGVALVTGLSPSQNDRTPLYFFIGWWLSATLFMVIPGLLVGGIVGLATKKSTLGLWIMGLINLAGAAAIFYGSII